MNAQIITDKKVLQNAIKSIARRNNTFNDDLFVIAQSCVMQAEKHGNADYALKLVKALGTRTRVSRALREWLTNEHCSPIRITGQGSALDVTCRGWNKPTAWNIDVMFAVNFTEVEYVPREIEAKINPATKEDTTSKGSKGGKAKTDVELLGQLEKYFTGKISAVADDHVRDALQQAKEALGSALKQAILAEAGNVQKQNNANGTRSVAPKPKPKPKTTPKPKTAPKAVAAAKTAPKPKPKTTPKAVAAAKTAPKAVAVAVANG